MLFFAWTVITSYSIHYTKLYEDTPGHYGKDFLVLMPATDETGAQAAASRLIARLKGTRDFDDGNIFKFSINIGIATHPVV